MNIVDIGIVLKKNFVYIHAIYVQSFDFIKPQKLVLNVKWAHQRSRLSANTLPAIYNDTCISLAVCSASQNTVFTLGDIFNYSQC